MANIKTKVDIEFNPIFKQGQDFEKKVKSAFSKASAGKGQSSKQKSIIAKADYDKTYLEELSKSSDVKPRELFNAYVKWINSLTELTTTFSKLDAATEQKISQFQTTIKNLEKQYDLKFNQFSELSSKGYKDPETGQFIYNNAVRKEKIKELGLQDYFSKKQFTSTKEETYTKYRERLNKLVYTPEGTLRTDRDPKQIAEVQERIVLLDNFLAQMRVFESEGARTFALLEKAVDKTSKELIAARSQISAELPKMEAEGVNELTVEGIRTANQAKEEQKKIEKELVEEKQKLNEAESKGAEATEKNTNAVQQAVKSFFGYQLVLRQLRKLWNDAINTIKELDKALTEQAVVSSLNRQETWKLVQTYQELALATGFTTTEIAAVATQYFRQGKTTKEVITLTEAAAKAAKVAGIDARQSVDFLTTAINGFKYAAEDAMMISDKFAALAASSATDYEELAIALSKVASQASLAGMSMDYTLGLLAKGIETTREPAESIGTALKTVIARMRELTDYGETLEEGTNINNVEKQLAYVNVALRDQNGELRSTEAVLDDVGRKWETLSSTQQASIAKALAGSRQQSRLISILNDYERTLELVEIASNSIGATSAQQVEYMEGMDAALNGLKTSYQAFITSLTNNEGIIMLINLIADIIGGIAKLFSNWEGTLLLVAVAATLLIKNFDILTEKARLLLLKIKDMKSNHDRILEKLKEQTAELRKQKELTTGAVPVPGEAGAVPVPGETGATPSKLATGAKAAVGFVAQWGPIIAIITAAAITLIRGVMNASKEAAEKTMSDITKKQAEIYENVQVKNTFTKLLDSFDKLSSKTIKTAEDFDELEKIRLAMLENFSSEERASKQNMTADQLANEARIKSQELETENKEKTKEIENLIRKAGPLDLKKELAATAVLIGAGGFAGAKIGGMVGGATGTAAGPLGTALGLSAGAGVGAVIGASAGGIAGLTAMTIKAIENKQNRKKIQEMLKTDEGVNQIKYGITSSFDTSRAGDLELGKTIAGTYQSVISRLSADELEKLVTGKDGFEEISNKFQDIMIQNSESLTTLNDTNQPLQDRLASLKDIMNELEPGILRDNFIEMNQELLDLERVYGRVLPLIDKHGYSIERLGEIADAAKESGLTEEETAGLITDLDKALAKGSIEETVDALRNAFGDLDPVLQNLLLNLITNGNSLQDLAERQTKMSSEYSNIKSTQAKWSTLTPLEQSNFLMENADLFSDGKGGIDAEKYNRFISGANMDAEVDAVFAERQKDMVDQYEANLIAAQYRRDQVQEKINNTQDEAEKERLKKELEAANAEIFATEQMIKATEKMFEESLADRVKTQQEVIKYQKEYLEEQKKKELEFLERRKEAYEKYYEALDKAEQALDYEQNRAKLLEQIGKLGAGADATSNEKRMAIEQQLRELDEQRAEERKQIARDAVIENIDSQIEKTNEKYDKMLENDQELLRLTTSMTRYQYAALLDGKNLTPEAIAQSMAEFDAAFARAGYNTTEIPAVSLNQSAGGEVNNTFSINVGNQTLNLTKEEQTKLETLIRQIIRRSGYSPQYGG